MDIQHVLLNYGHPFLVLREHLAPIKVNCSYYGMNKLCCSHNVVITRAFYGSIMGHSMPNFHLNFNKNITYSCAHVKH